MSVPDIKNLGLLILYKVLAVNVIYYSYFAVLFVIIIYCVIYSVIYLYMYENMYEICQ